MNTWVIVRPVVVLILGVFLIHTIGRWEGRIDQRERDHDQQYKAFLEQRTRYSELRIEMLAVEDSLRTVDSLLTIEESRNNALLVALDSVDETEDDSLAAVPLADLLPPLRLHFHGFSEGSPVYATDSTGVRFLAGRMLLLSQTQRRAVTLEQLAVTHGSRITNLTRLAGTASARADSAEAQLAIATALLGESETLRRRRAKWLGFIPKPPRLLVLAIGVGAGYVIAR